MGNKEQYISNLMMHLLSQYTPTSCEWEQECPPNPSCTQCSSASSSPVQMTLFIQMGPVPIPKAPLKATFEAKLNIKKMLSCLVLVLEIL